MAKEKLFALYKGDKFLDIGTAKELAKKQNVTPDFIKYLSTPANLRRFEKGNNRLIAVKLEDAEDI